MFYETPDAATGMYAELMQRYVIGWVMFPKYLSPGLPFQLTMDFFWTQLLATAPPENSLIQASLYLFLKQHGVTELQKMRVKGVKYEWLL